MMSKLLSPTRTFLILVLLAILHVARTQNRLLQFNTNTTGVYTFEYNETNLTLGITPVLPSHFRIECLLNGMAMENVTYSLISDGGGTFKMNEDTGALSVQAGYFFDYENITQYLLSSKCRLEVDSEELSDIGQINFNILPVNEFKPQIQVTQQPGKGKFVKVNELSEIGQIIATKEVQPPESQAIVYSVSDDDQGQEENLYTTLKSGDDISIFNVDSSGTVTLGQRLDLDRLNLNEAIITMQIRVCDVNPPTDANCNELVLFIVTIRSNDNDPTFSQDIYSVTVAESYASNGFLVNVSCIDKDIGTGEFSNVTSSSSSFSVFFSPEMSNQSIYHVAPLDFESVSIHSIMLTCTDTGGKNTTATLIVNVMAINDNQPHFSTKAYSFQISRFSTIGSEVGRLEGIDKDREVGNQLIYTWTYNKNFQLIKEDGLIILRDFVYAVESEAFIFDAMVTDGEFNDTATVMIKINGILSVPEVILICMGALIFIVLVVSIIVCCCYCCICCSRLLPKQRRTRSTEILAQENAVILEPMTSFPMHEMPNMYNQGSGPNYILGKIPIDSEGPLEGALAGASSDDYDELGSCVTTSSHVYMPTSNLNEMVEKFIEGDDVLDGKKRSKKSIT